MTDEGNFDKLIAGMDAIGIDTRIIGAALWRAVEQETSLKAIAYQDQQARVVLDVGTDRARQTVLFDYTVYYPMNGGSEHVQAFDNTVPLQDAKSLLQLRIAKNID